MNDYQLLQTYQDKQKDLIRDTEKVRAAKLAQKAEKKNAFVRLITRG